VPRLSSLITSCCESSALSDNLFLLSRVEHELPFLYFTFGCHPSNYREYDDELEGRLLEALKSAGSRAVAWGECGLDYVKQHSDAEDPMKRAAMIDVFARQAKLAVVRRLPLVIHSRDADDDTMRVLREMPRSHKVYIHGFQGSVQFMEDVLALLPNSIFGLSAGIAKPYPWEECLEVARRCPLDRLVLESDAPFVAFEPLAVPAMAAAVARVRDVTAGEVLARTTTTCEKFFGIKPMLPTDGVCEF